MGRKNKSVVWAHFINLSRDSAKCTLCSSTLKCTSSTTNLKEHLKRKHPLHVNKSVDFVNPDDPVLSNSPTINTTTSETVPVTFNDDNIPSSFASSIQLNRSRQLTLIPTRTMLPESKKKKLDLLITKMICKDLQTWSVVENEGFKELISELESRYILPSRRTITRNFLPDLYKTTREIVQNTLNEVKYVSLTTDIWSSINVQSFITVTAHLIHNDKLCSYVLETRKLNTNHTAHNIACVLNNIFEQWCIQNKICAIVTDGGTNITSACKDHLEINHLPYNVHVINLVAKNAVKKVTDAKEILQKCRKIVEHFKSSTTAMERLRSMQQQMGCPILKLKQDILTRWNSTLLMIERLITIKEPLSATLGVLNRPPESVNEDEWNNLHDFVLLLKPLEQITIELSCEKYVSLSKIIPLVRGLQTLLKDTVVSSKVALQLKNKIINEFNNRFGVCEKDKIPNLSC